MIFPKTQHLKLMMYASSLTGTWPYIFENNPALKKLYNNYFKVVLCCYISYTVCAMIKFFILVTKDDVNTTEVVTDLGIALINSIAILRLRVISGEGIKSIVREIINFEEKILQCSDEKIIKIYNSHVKQSQISSALFMINMTCGYIFLIIYPLTLLNTIIFNATTNDTAIIKVVPVNLWLPFDQQKYYFCAYMWCVFTACISILFLTTIDTYIFSLIIFFLGQIKILKQILTDFQEYVMKVKNQLQCTRDEASFVTMRECILKHKEIIQYVEQYNNELRSVMLLDFLQSSIQLASIAVNLFMIDRNFFSIAWYITFAYTVSYTLCVTYWYANEIMEHSSELNTALYNSIWYEEPIKVQKMMIIMMMRCNRPLCLEIGLIGTMTLNTFIGVIKATYSYMMLVYE